MKSLFIITTMRQGSDQMEIKQQLSKFINLLQTDFRQSNHDSPTEVGRLSCEHPLHKKLSVIFSASQPESSSLDKENSNPSANRSFETSQKCYDTSNYQSVMSSLLTTHLTPSQHKMVEAIKLQFQQLRLENQKMQGHICQLRNDLCSQKKANDQMLSVLIKLDGQQKQLWSNFNVVSSKYNEANEKNKLLEGQFQHLNSQLLALQNDNDFMKKLIYHANQSYEALERKINELEHHNKVKGDIMRTDRKSPKKSSMDNLLKSAKTKKNGYSPSHSELGRNVSPQRFQDIYQKMIIRTLKLKGRNP